MTVADRSAPFIPIIEPIDAPVVDAHAHTWSREFDGEYDIVMRRAWDAGVVAVVEVGTGVDSSLRALDLARRDPRVRAVAGLHPHSASRMAGEGAGLERLVENGDFVAIGEIGLDFYRNLSPPAAQYEAFLWQLELAVEHSLPVVIHSRNADAESFEVLRSWAERVGRYPGPDREIGMMHCYAGNLELARRYLDIGFLISIPGTVTYANNTRGQEVARELPSHGILVETDCPYLTPQPYRGKRNEPALVVETVRAVAALRDEAPEAVASSTAANAARLFGFELET